ncbi:nodulation efficiency protein NfeD [Longilinea arvoryzae]|uniref:Nodulation efficiency protein NfeD n=1 Tax=Longilinea arvoryzae TaxID=360412 RepID=A0A0S7BIB2_9CHLR|nr:nodulation protein NfeD [Longilinea arvoryzae]GAP13890.1 nodulation efficiency protein NfeD [Longilinea arvoryzae]
MKNKTREISLRKHWIRMAAIGLLLSCLLLPVGLANAQTGAGTPTAVVLTADGAVTPVMVGYIERGLKIAVDRGADVVVLQLNTPGGQIDQMTEIVGLLRSSEIPVIVYVTPRGAMAASAGTLITLAGHLAAMAPETMIGAASPVGGQGEDLGETLATKEKEALKATVRSLTTGRRPDSATQMAESAVEDARAFSAQEALDAGLIDWIAPNLETLLQLADGKSVLVLDQTVTLHTAGATTYTVPSTLIEQLLSFLINPNVVFLLLSIGVQAILIELSSPGGWVAGFIGAVCLLLAIYGLGVLPVNWFGLLFMLMAFVLFIVDIKAPTHGALTAAGLGSFIAGALILFNSVRVPGLPRLSVPLVIGTGLFMAASFSVIISFAVRAMHLPVKTGKTTLIGKRGQVRSPLNPGGTVQVAGELWSAELVDPTQAPLPRNTAVEVVEIDGVRLKVRRAG